MTAETTSRSNHRGAVLPVLALAALGVALRFRFVDTLTKLTGTWMGGVESPSRTGTANGQGSSVR